jgi:hypothetical protein
VEKIRACKQKLSELKKYENIIKKKTSKKINNLKYAIKIKLQLQFRDQELIRDQSLLTYFVIVNCYPTSTYHRFSLYMYYKKIKIKIFH